MNTVTFPGLGLEFTIDPVAFSIGTFQIYWYGVIIALGFFLGVSFCCWQAKKFGLKPDDILDMILFAAPGGIIGARIYYIVFNPGLYLNDDGSLNIMACLDIHRGGLAIYGGIIAGVIIAFWWRGTKRSRSSPWQMCAPLACSSGRSLAGGETL